MLRSLNEKESPFDKLCLHNERSYQFQDGYKQAIRDRRDEMPHLQNRDEENGSID